MCLVFASLEDWIMINLSGVINRPTAESSKVLCCAILHCSPFSYRDRSTICIARLRWVADDQGSIQNALQKLERPIVPLHSPNVRRLALIDMLRYFARLHTVPSEWSRAASAP